MSGGMVWTAKDPEFLIRECPEADPDLIRVLHAEFPRLIDWFRAFAWRSTWRRKCWATALVAESTSRRNSRWRPPLSKTPADVSSRGRRSAALALRHHAAAQEAGDVIRQPPSRYLHRLVAK
jgi:hypothetical protein